MPSKQKEYDRVIFTPEVIMQAVELIGKVSGKPVTLSISSITLPSGEEWSHDNQDEFFADYRKGFKHVRFTRQFMDKGSIHISYYGSDATVDVYLPKREEVERVFAVFEANVEACRLPPQPVIQRTRPKVKVFVGHGHSTQWRDLKDHLHDKHGLEVEAYETGARAGLTIRDVLDDLLTKSSFAALVLTGEDTDASGNIHARENVIHELGLFQGRLGWRKAVALVEEGSDPSQARRLDQSTCIFSQPPNALSAASELPASKANLQQIAFDLSYFTAIKNPQQGSLHLNMPEYDSSEVDNDHRLLPAGGYVSIPIGSAPHCTI